MTDLDAYTIDVCPSHFRCKNVQDWFKPEAMLRIKSKDLFLYCLISHLIGIRVRPYGLSQLKVLILILISHKKGPRWGPIGVLVAQDKGKAGCTKP